MTEQSSNEVTPLVAETQASRDQAFLRASRPGNPRVFGGGELAFSQILRRVEESESTIEMRAFLWRDDECGNRLGRALLAAAERGVKVHILKDRIAAVYEYCGGKKQSFFHKRVAPGQGFQAWFLGITLKNKGSFKQRPNSLAAKILAHPNIEVGADLKGPHQSIGLNPGLQAREAGLRDDQRDRVAG